MNATPESTAPKDLRLSPENPWPSLRAYSTINSDFFFGRDAEISELFRRVRRQVLTVLFSESGLGKTSLLQAGLIPRLLKNASFPVLIRLDHRLEAEDLTEQVWSAIGSAMGRYREASHRGEISDQDLIAPRDPEPGEDFWSYFHDKGVEWRTKAGEIVCPVLIFDQFEEIFSHESRTRAQEDRKQRFLESLACLIENNLPESVEQRGGREEGLFRRYDSRREDYRVVLSLREDFLAQLESLKRRIPSIMENRMQLTPMNEAQAMQVVLEPARKLELVDESVAREIVLAAVAQSRGQKSSPEKPSQKDDRLVPFEVSPAHLCLVCYELNRQRGDAPKITGTGTQLEAQVRDIVRDYYERCFQAIESESTRKLARRLVEDQLVKQGFRDSISLEVARTELKNQNANPQALNELVEERLLQLLVDHHGQHRLELSHDILIKPALESKNRHKMACEAASAAAERRRRWGKLAGVFGMVLLVITVLCWEHLRNVQAAAEAANRATSETDFALAADQVQVHNTRGSLAYLADALQKNPRNARATALTLSLLRNCPIPWFVLQHKDEVQDASFSPDGTLVVTASEDGTAKLWNPKTGESVGPAMKHDDWVHIAAFSPDGRWVVTASWDGTARVWNGTNGQPRLNSQKQPVVMRHGDYKVYDARFSPDGLRVATACHDGKARIWNAETGELMTNTQTHNPIVLQHGDKIWTVCFSPDGQHLVTASADKTARVWDVWSGEPATNQAGKPIVLNHRDEVNCAFYSPYNGGLIVTGSDDKTAGIWNAHTGEKMSEINHSHAVNRISFSPDNRRMVTASSDHTAQVWELNLNPNMTATTSTPVGKPMQHKGIVCTARFSPDGRRVVTASYDGTARVWDAETGKPVSRPLNNGSAVYMANFSPDGRSVVTASFDSFARIWAVQSGEGDKILAMPDEVTSAVFSPNSLSVLTASGVGTNWTARIWSANNGGLMLLMRQTNSILAAKFSPDSQRILTTSTNGPFQLWDAQTGGKIGTPMMMTMAAEAGINTVDFSANGDWLATSFTNGCVCVWNGHNGQPITNAQGEPLIFPPGVNIQTRTRCTSFSPDGNFIVTAGDDGVARIWTVRSNVPPRELKHHGIVYTARFSPDSSLVLTASADHRARIWDIRTTNNTPKELRHDGWVNDAKFSPDGTTVVTASNDRTARVWDVQTGRPISEPMWHDKDVVTANFSPDGRWVVTVSLDGTARLWDAQTGGAISEPVPDWGDWGTNKVRSASFSPDGKWIVTTSDDNTARIWESPMTAPNAPPWLANFAEDVAGWRLNSSRVLERVAHDSALLQTSQESLRKLTGDDDLSRFGRWVVADPATRTISPFSPMTPHEFVEQKLAETNSPVALEEAYEAAPGDPLVLVSLAKLKFLTDANEALLYCDVALTNSQLSGSADQIRRVQTIAHSLFPGQPKFDVVPSRSPQGP